MTTAAALTAQLAAWNPAEQPISVVAGFDGFVDEMIHIVGERQSVDSWTAMPTMADLGQVLIGASGRNGLREMVVRSVDAGGCSVNLSDGLADVGVAVHHFGTTGQPLHPAFAAFANKCASLTAVGSVVGRSMCLEFTDGKFFLAAVDQLKDITVAVIRELLAQGSYVSRCQQAAVIVLNNWTLYPSMTAIWQILATEVFPTFTHRPWVFVDLVDPSARTVADITAMVATVARFEPHVRVSFGVNLTEASVLCAALGLDKPGAGVQALATTAAVLQQRLGVTEVVVHNRDGNAVAQADSQVSVEPGPRCRQPIKSTGAGDRFNAGYCLGLALGLPATQRLDLGSAVAGVFLRQGRSATMPELLQFLSDWAAGRVAS